MVGVPRDRRGGLSPPPDDLMLFRGMSIGYEDGTGRHTRTCRAPLDETVTFVEP